ncbi:MAG TPA: hypothetical protein VGR35_03120 [Tepidisphaeraceae bacterium]|nr:hypothetical protein [Tepidisphaeraceae bacterium]
MKRWIPLLTVLLTLAVTSAALACPNCKDSITNTAAGGVSSGLPAGFNYSIYFMLLGLFAVLGFVGFTIVKAVRASDAHSSRRGFPLRKLPL